MRRNRASKSCSVAGLKRARLGAGLLLTPGRMSSIHCCLQAIHTANSGGGGGGGELRSCVKQIEKTEEKKKKNFLLRFSDFFGSNIEKKKKQPSYREARGVVLSVLPALLDFSPTQRQQFNVPKSCNKLISIHTAIHPCNNPLATAFLVCVV